jgi:hypothetical protein
VREAIESDQSQIEKEQSDIAETVRRLRYLHSKIKSMGLPSMDTESVFSE